MSTRRFTEQSCPLDGKSVKVSPLGFPRGESKNRNRELIPFDEPLCPIRFRADAIRPYIPYGKLLPFNERLSCGSGRVD